MAWNAAEGRAVYNKRPIHALRQIDPELQQPGRLLYWNRLSATLSAILSYTFVTAFNAGLFLNGQDLCKPDYK
jgi:hypothetical protein